VAAAALRAAGMQILARNLRNRLGELDIVARDGGTLVFVEVKSRSEGSPLPPELSVTTSKQRKLRRLAEAYLSTHSQIAEQADGCRFDVVAVSIPRRGRPEVRHLRDAFQ
jgi:putative endonuclease